MTRALQNHGRPGCLLMLVLLCIGGCGMALASNPPTDVLRESFSCIELNRVFAQSETEDGEWIETRLTFEQFCFISWDAHLQQHILEAWRMRKNGETVRYNHATGYYELRWKDGDIDRLILARSYRERDSLFDWELDQRQGVGPSQRRELRKK